MKKSKNEVAWEEIFKEQDILNKLTKQQTVSISAKDINLHRQARLMTKFDNSDQIPTILKKNKLNVLPESRKSYLLGKFEIFQKLNHQTIKPITKTLPNYIQSIDINNITSESIALNIAHMSGMIDQVMQTDNYKEPSLLTLTGRMSSGLINYEILDKQKRNYHLTADNAQIEIDGSYENKNKIVIIEAKTKIPKDFNIRQLYYPYRVYQGLNTHKEIIPIFFTFADDIFSFHVFKFTDLMNYSSIKKVNQIDFLLNHSLNLDLKAVIQISKNVAEVPESQAVPFPQANKFSRILDMIDYISKPINKHDLAKKYDFNIRQSDYYANCLFYLGLATKQDGLFQLTQSGLTIKKLPNSNERNYKIIEKILAHKVFNLAFQSTLKNNGNYDRNYICNLILQNIPSVKKSTISRRASSVIGWLKWIFSVIDY